MKKAIKLKPVISTSVATLNIENGTGEVARPKSGGVGGDKLQERDAALRGKCFTHEEKPMLSQKGTYPVRVGGCIIDSEWPWNARADLQVSPWLHDWECSLERAGWTVIRKERWGKQGLPYDMHPAEPHDADLYSPKLGVYLSLLPSKIPLAGTVIDLFGHMRSAYPGSLVIMHARKPSKHFFQTHDDDRTINLLSAKNTARCIEMKGLVEFQGVLYEPEAIPEGEGDSYWRPTLNPTALEVYHQYRLNSVYYHRDQELMDRGIAETMEKAVHRVLTPEKVG